MSSCSEQQVGSQDFFAVGIVCACNEDAFLVYHGTQPRKQELPEEPTQGCPEGQARQKTRERERERERSSCQSTISSPKPSLPATPMRTVFVSLEKQHDEKDFFKLKTILKSRTSSNEEPCHRPGVACIMEPRWCASLSPNLCKPSWRQTCLGEDWSAEACL